MHLGKGLENSDEGYSSKCDTSILMALLSFKIKL